MGCFSLLSLSANASTLISSTEYIDYELPKTVQDQCYKKSNCPEIEVKYLKTNHDWINNIVNARINNLVINSKPSESPVNKSTTIKAAKLAIDDFARSQFKDMPADSSGSYSLLVKPEYLGHVQKGHVQQGHVQQGHVQQGSTKSTQTEDFELFEINSYVFTGGAHGMPLSEYLIFDVNSKKQVTLADMLQPGKQSRFKALAYQAYKEWVKTVDEDVSNYEKNWPFTLSDNVTLTDKGVNIRYQHYDIGPYAYGMPLLSIPYAKLSGIIKPSFLAK
ncbi:MAG: RsiV family protein [Psychrobacter urativorans]